MLLFTLLLLRDNDAYTNMIVHWYASVTFPAVTGGTAGVTPASESGPGLRLPGDGALLLKSQDASHGSRDKESVTAVTGSTVRCLRWSKAKRSSKAHSAHQVESTVNLAATAGVLESPKCSLSDDSKISLMMIIPGNSVPVVIDSASESDSVKPGRDPGHLEQS
jgi:hypothetical protein